jgi:uncharacterized membrane-anchored protein
MIRLFFPRPTILCLRILCVSALAALPLFPALAAKEAISREQAEALVSGLKYQQGEIALQNGLATVRVPDGFRFLNGSDAQTVLVKLWGNPPSSDPVGMLMPAEVSPLTAESWAVVLTYEPDGYISDKDAEKINYAELLAQMQKDMVSANEERQKGGYEPIHLIGWAKAPRYDSQTHKLYWAKELKFGSQPENTLNYNIRMLGRGGVLVLNGIAAMSQLPDIEQATPKILGAIDFNPGHRYADFNPKSDKIASYGLAALVAGGAAATAVKLGLFKGLWLAILAAKKFIIIGVVAIVASFRKLFKRKETTT